MAPSITNGAVIPRRRRPPTKVTVFRAPCGAWPTSRSPRGARPRSRTIAVFVQVSSMNTSREQVKPSWYGDSVGYYDGDTLVVDTVGIKVGPYAMVDWYGTPHTEALHLVERYRLLDAEAAKDGFERDAKQHNANMGAKTNPQGKFLQLRFTVEDSGVFTTPWTATMTYRISPNGWEEEACAENIYWYSGKEADVPRAEKPDF
jgi:hypothetical protein